MGGESTRPGAAEVPVPDETARILPVIGAARGLAPVSVDTRKAAVAQAAIAAGAVDETGVRAAPYGRIAGFADPFGHGFCLIEFNERGYDAIVTGEGAG